MVSFCDVTVICCSFGEAEYALAVYLCNLILQNVYVFLNFSYFHMFRKGCMLLQTFCLQI